MQCDKSLLPNEAREPDFSTDIISKKEFQKHKLKNAISKNNFKKTFSKIQMHCDKSLLPMRQDILIYFFFFKHTNAI